MIGWYIVHGTGIRIYHKGLYAELSYWFFSKIKVFKITARTAPQVTEASRPHWSHAVIILVCCNMHASKVSSTFTTYMM